MVLSVEEKREYNREHYRRNAERAKARVLASRQAKKSEVKIENRKKDVSVVYEDFSS